jgi:sugar/nucleoside kinase (ribokinase family)
MDQNTLHHLLTAPPQGKIGVLGDFCTDVYWDIHPELGEDSIETGLKTLPVTLARYSLGGAGNIVANLRGIGLTEIPCFGVSGKDPFGIWMKEELTGGIPAYASCFQMSDRKAYHTPVYCKPLINAVEQQRIDLGNTPVSDEEADQLLSSLEKFMPQFKVLIVNEQIKNGIHSPRFRAGFAELVRRFEGKISMVFDGRDFLDSYPGVTLKINAHAASCLAFGDPSHAPQDSGKLILERSGRELVITDGANGCYVFEHARTTFIPAIPAPGPVDTVGAGDSFTAGFSYALAAGASMVEAAEFGNCCSAVTIRKLNQTGAPSPEELCSVLQEVSPKA